MTTDIPIKYVNATGSTDFEVVVFTKNFNLDTPKVYYAAWQILRGQSEVDFNYPVSMSIGATYQSGDQTIKAGPFEAKLGSTWDITQDSIDATATLKEKSGVQPNDDGSIVIKNNPPTTWSGRKFDVGIYKSGKLLVIQKDVHVGDQVDFILQSKLYFGVVQNMQVGDVFTSLQITQNLTEFALNDHPNGMTVTLKEAPGGGGQYIFSTE